jgi:tetratricopeptide (TPR) repeat protein
MALDEEISLLFENYLDNQLSEADKTDFEKKLKEDASFASDFKTYKEISHYLANQFSEERNLLKTQLEQLGANFSYTSAEASSGTRSEETLTETTSTTKKSPKVIRFKPWKIAFAASFILTFGIFLFQSGSGLQQSDYMFSDDITLTQRSDDNTLMKEAEINFNTEDYADAVVSFDKILENYPNNTEVQFYKAIALDALENYTDSDELFSELSRGGSIFRYKATYYWAVSQWKQDNVERAETILNEIPRNAEEYKQAQKLLKKL